MLAVPKHAREPRCPLGARISGISVAFIAGNPLAMSALGRRSEDSQPAGSSQQWARSTISFQILSPSLRYVALDRPLLGSNGVHGHGGTAWAIWSGPALIPPFVAHYNGHPHAADRKAAASPRFPQHCQPWGAFCCQREQVTPARQVWRVYFAAFPRSRCRRSHRCHRCCRHCTGCHRQFARPMRPVLPARQFRRHHAVKVGRGPRGR